ncbi:hypothetical protein SCHPADRAFT_936951 [Schizopora paradoxa]|uniref:Uncharacterized protein n=1 Tax=Schizopora paradoxa TaxID=27342 RepID=A0A0H2S154_9AGAM|nr:hypothetical protein SCHPADRAFT_936951 [Schizopora paradoxa]
MVPLNSPDVILHIALFLDDEKKDLKNLSFVNRVLYETLTTRRVRHLRVHYDGLPSLALFLIRNDAFRYCRSLTILEELESFPEPFSLDYDFHTSLLQRFSKAIILRVLGTCKQCNLQYYEGDCLLPTQPLLSKFLKPFTFLGDGSRSFIILSRSSEEEERKTLQWFFPEESSHYTSLQESEGQGRDTQFTQDVVFLPQSSGAVRRILTPEVDIPSWRFLLEDLVLSYQSIEEMNLRITNMSAWNAIIRADWSRLTRLTLHVFKRQVILDPPHSQLVLNALESLKIKLENNFVDKFLLLDITLPNLRSLLFSGRKAEKSNLNEFLIRHASQIEDLSLDCDTVPSLDCLNALRALHLNFKQRSTIVHMQLLLWSQTLPHVVHLRVPEWSFASLMQNDFPVYRNSDSDHTWPRKLRCLELEYVRVEEIKSFIDGIMRLYLFQELKELAFIINEEVGEVRRLQEIIPPVLKVCAVSKTLMAIRFVCKAQGEVYPHEMATSCCNSMIPENLRYLTIETGRARSTFQVTTFRLSVAPVDSVRHVALPSGCLLSDVRFKEIPPLRPLPAPGKRTIDWIDESIYDHVSPNYDAY